MYEIDIFTNTRKRGLKGRKERFVNMENYAKKIAIEHKVSGKASFETFPKKELMDDFKVITFANKVLNECIQLDVTIPPSGEWLLDNYYLIEEQVNSLKHELKEKEYIKLPSINGTARCFILAKKLVEFTDGNLTDENIISFLNSYQSQKMMEMREIWMFSSMLKIALIQYIRKVSEKIIVSQFQKLKVESLIERLVKKIPYKEQKFIRYKNLNVDCEATSYVEHLTYLLKKVGKDGIEFLEILEDEVKRVGTTISNVIKVEHYDLTLRRVSIANSITSIRRLSRLNWAIIFTKTNGMDQILKQDKWYEKLDYETKDEYRNYIQKIAEKTNISEIYIANKLIEIAKEDHIGNFLIGDEKEKLYIALGVEYKEPKNKLFWYIFSIYIPSLIVAYFSTGNLFWISWLPISEIFVNVINRIISKKIVPRKIPRVEKIDEEVETFVIVPTLLNNKERVKQMMKNLEIYYLANQSEKLFFALLGDVSESHKEIMEYDEEIMQVGQKEAEKLNKKYNKEIFYFLYRKRIYNSHQGKWLGYERKRGMIIEFNRFLLTGENGTFQINTIKNIPNVKYVITLDADTELPIDTAKKLIGIMEHPLNQPVVKNGRVIKGYGIIQPKVSISIHASTASLFSKIFAGTGGIDIYSNAESNVYQDLFDEAIFTGKGIYNLKVFQEILEGKFPENRVLSHDLLEGCYLRCGLASDIEVIDGFPARVNSYMVRQQRWVRGDWQIISWLWKKSLNNLSKYKIWDNLRRSLVDILTFTLFLNGNILIGLLVVFNTFLIDVLDRILLFSSSKKKNVTKNYLPIISGLKGSIYRCFLNLLFIPYKFVLMLEAILKTLYRVFISKKNLLEWLTAEEAEKVLGKDLKSFIREMIVGHILGWCLIFISFIKYPEYIMFSCVLTFLWLLTPLIAYEISLTDKPKKEKISQYDEKYILDIAKKTWTFFEDYMIKENNYLPPDNYQELRKNTIVNITSSTNIGLGFLAILSAYDLKFIEEIRMMDLFQNLLNTIESLEKWNGHLYNWYDIHTLEPLHPKFVSTVDSGNFVGYLYVIKQFFYEQIEQIQGGFKVEFDEHSKRNIRLEKYYSMYKIVSKLIEETDFSKLYDESKSLFSMGYDFRENKFVDSYYDLLASEARQASFVAIAKRDVPYKHWFNLGRTLTTVHNKKGLISWSGTMFEYFMPSIIMNSFRYTLLDETYDFCIYSQKEYAKKLRIPWGMSEAAFNLLDLNYNYQYKAFGVPWLGVKRGLKDEIVISPYSTFLVLSRDTQSALRNLREMEKLGACEKYGFYESIDYTPNRTSKGKFAIVKTYMAHHQGLILCSINNFISENILIKRFSKNPEIQMVSILLQEKVPQNIVYTNNNKEKVKSIKYKYYEEYREKELKKEQLNMNILSNEQYTLLIDTWGRGYSEWKNKRINRFKSNNEQTNFCYIKNIQTGECWSNFYMPVIKEPEEYLTIFSSAISKFIRKDGNILTTTRIAVSPEDNIEIREIQLENHGETEVELDIISYLDPIICDKDTDITFPAFNKLFFYPHRYQNAVILERRERNTKIENTQILVVFFENAEDNAFEIETDKMKILGNCNSVENAIIIEQDRSYSQELKIVTDTAISFKKNVRIKSNEKKKIYFAISVSKHRDELESNYKKLMTNNYYERVFELAIAKSIIENRFLRFKYEEIELYNKIIYEILYGSSTRKRYLQRIKNNHLKQKDLWKFGISGDLPIILVRIKHPNEIEMVKQLIRAMEYFKRKNLKLDLVILDDEKNGYEQYTWDKIIENINSLNLNYLLYQNSGIHLLKHNLLNEEEVNLLYACSDVILDAHSGILEEQLYENGRVTVL